MRDDEENAEKRGGYSHLFLNKDKKTVKINGDNEQKKVYSKLHW